MVRNDTVARSVDVREAGAHLLVHDDRAPGAELRTCLFEKRRIGADSDDGKDQVGGVRHRLTEVLGVHDEPRIRLLHGLHPGVRVHLDAVPEKFGVDRGRKLGIESRQHLGPALQLDDPHTASAETLGHLEADVAGADDDRGPRVTLGEMGVQGEGVTHRVDDVNAVCRPERPEPHYAGVSRKRARADDQLVVRDLGFSALIADGQPLRARIDPGRESVQPQSHTRRLEIRVRPVREGLPGLHVAREVVGDAADRVVRILISDDDGHVDRGVEFSGTERRGDSRVASADGDNVHVVFLFSGVWRFSGVRRVRLGRG
mgnify:CR=1 FL=1